MKRILLILILIVSPLYAQFDVWGQFGGNPFSFYDAPMNRAVTYNARAQAFFDRVTALGKTLTDAQKQTYDSIFTNGIKSGYLGTTRTGDSLQNLYVLPLKISGDSAVSKLNILDTSYVLINIGSVWHDSGATNSATTYLYNRWNPIKDSSISKVNSTSLIVYMDSLKNNSGAFFINNTAGGGTSIIRLNGQLQYKLYGAFNSVTYTVTDWKGMNIITRQSATKTMLSLNGVEKYYATDNMTAIYDGVYQYGQSGVRIFKVIGNSTGLSIDKQTKLSNDINNVFKKYSLNVY